MKESLQAYVEKPISVLETGSIIQTHTGENAWLFWYVTSPKKNKENANKQRF